MTGLRDRLREVTRDDHTAVEEALRLGGTVDRATLSHALARLLGFLAPLEARLRGVAAAELPDVAERARAPALRANLEALGVRGDVPECTDLPAIDDAGAALGALYVLEGALLGAPTVAAGLARSGLPATAFEVPAEETRRRWRTLLARLEAPRDDAERVVAGARDTFAALRRWVEPEAALSREFALELAADGTVTAADPRAAALVRLHAGDDLVARSVDPVRTRRFLDEPDLPWELSLQVGDAVVTCGLRARRKGAGLEVVGSLVPQDYGRLVRDLHETIGELAGLQRETQRQKVEIERHYTELRRLHAELEESGRGVVALHEEVDAQSILLRREEEVRSKIVAHVSHEFRTPLNSVLGIARLLEDEADGPLNDEQRRQVGFVRRSAEALASLVDDMLDLSRLEAGRAALHVTTFTVADLFAALRGMMRPLVTHPAVELVFEDPGDLELTTDEGKVAQVLRNYVSNALKFTEAGEVRVAARELPDGEVSFSVADTGIGIPVAQQDKLFQEFVQIENPLQRRVKGTGLGLSIARRLGELLAGSTSASSAPGRGSRFSLTIPRVHPDETAFGALRDAPLEPDRAPVLVVEDDRQTLFMYERYLRGSGFQVIATRTTDAAREALRRVRPSAVVLDVMLDGESSWAFLRELKSSDTTRDIPVLVVTVTHREDTARALGADEFFAKPVEGDWLVRKLAALSKVSPRRTTLLVVDDDEALRYVLRRRLTAEGFRVVEAPDGAEALRLARTDRPDAILLDFVMPGMSAFDVIDELKADPALRDIPVFVHTSKDLEHEERERLARDAEEILHKQSLSREVAMARIREALHKAGVVAGGRKAT